MSKASTESGKFAAKAIGIIGPVIGVGGFLVSGIQFGFSEIMKNDVGPTFLLIGIASLIASRVALFVISFGEGSGSG